MTTKDTKATKDCNNVFDEQSGPQQIGFTSEPDLFREHVSFVSFVSFVVNAFSELLT
jgi:hypothetical protein